MNPIKAILEKLYSNGSYDEEFPTDPKRHTRIEDALTSIAEIYGKCPHCGKKILTTETD